MLKRLLKLLIDGWRGRRGYMNDACEAARFARRHGLGFGLYRLKRAWRFRYAARSNPTLRRLMRETLERMRADRPPH